MYIHVRKFGENKKSSRPGRPLLKNTQTLKINSKQLNFNNVIISIQNVKRLETIFKRQK
jgi:hypothetical protein